MEAYSLAVVVHHIHRVSKCDGIFPVLLDAISPLPVSLLSAHLLGKLELGFHAHLEFVLLEFHGRVFLLHLVNPLVKNRLVFFLLPLGQRPLPSSLPLVLTHDVLPHLSSPYVNIVF